MRALKSRPKQRRALQTRGTHVKLVALHKWYRDKGGEGVARLKPMRRRCHLTRSPLGFYLRSPALRVQGADARGLMLPW